MRFRASNSSDSDSDQKLVLTLNVSDSPWRAVLCLLAGLMAAYIPAKGLNFRTQQLTIQKQITGLGDRWLREEPQVLQVVWVLAMLRQAGDMSRWWWLRSPDVINDRLAQVTALAGVLDQARQLRREFDAAGWELTIRRRARAALNRVVANMGPPPVDAKLIGTAQAELTRLSDWLDKDKLDTVYWADLARAITELLAEVQPGSITNPDRRTVIQSLVGVLSNAASPIDRKGKITRESIYARLMILWERHGYVQEEFARLIELHNKQLRDLLDQQPQLQNQPIAQMEEIPIEPIFDLADNEAWKRLQNCLRNDLLTIPCPQTDDPNPCEAFQPLLFKLDTNDPILDKTYLLKHGLQYTWTFELFEGKRSSPWRAKADEPKIVWKAKSDEPQIVQYSALPGSLTPSVIITRDGVELFKAVGADRPNAVKGKPVKVAVSNDFKFREGFEMPELTALAVTFAIAVVTGLAVVYYKTATFGSFQDYVSLFIWGVGADLSKNGLQILQSNSTSLKP